jgi:hypothetical protein
VPPIPDDDLPRVTLALLRRADTMCPRRLAHEHESGRKLSRLGDAGFEVSNRVVEDATLWHKGRVDGDAERVAFPEPTDLAPEQLALYRAFARGYLATFDATEDVEVADLGWSTDIDDLGVRLLGQVGIPVEYPTGARELRLPRVGRGNALVDDADIRFALLRAAEWAPVQLRIVAFDPLDVRSVEYEIDVAARIDDAREWLSQRVAVIRGRAHPKQPVAGADCRHCSCLPGCPRITDAS